MQDETINRSNSAALEVRGSAAGTMKLMVLCALALLFAASILMDDYILSGKAWIVSWLLAPLAPFVFLLLLWRLIKGGVQLRIDDQGIHYPRWSAMPVRWDDIGHVVMTKAFSNYQLGISLYPAARAHYPKLGRWSSKLNRKISKIDIAITVTTMACKPADIMRAIHLHSKGRL